MVTENLCLPINPVTSLIFFAAKVSDNTEMCKFLSKNTNIITPKLCCFVPFRSNYHKQALQNNRISYYFGARIMPPRSCDVTVEQYEIRELTDNLLKRFANCDVAICSFTCTHGKADSNLTLSQRRADAVKTI